MGYGLLKCLVLLIKEQPELWYLYAITAVVSILGGKFQPYLQLNDVYLLTTLQVARLLCKLSCSPVLSTSSK